MGTDLTFSRKVSAYLFNSQAAIQLFSAQGGTELIQVNAPQHESTKNRVVLGGVALARNKNILDQPVLSGEKGAGEPEMGHWDLYSIFNGPPQS